MAGLSGSLKDDHNLVFFEQEPPAVILKGRLQQKTAQRMQGAELEPTARSGAAVSQLIAQFHLVLDSAGLR